MNCFKIALVASSLTAFLWAQGAPQNTMGTATPQSQQQQTSAQPMTGSPATANPSQAAQVANSAASPTRAAEAGKSRISGCMEESWGRFLVSDTATNTTYNVKGSGTQLSQYANHVVQVSGIPDPKEAKGNVTPFYAEQVQASGQGCGANANAQPAGTNQMGASAAPKTASANEEMQTSQPGGGTEGAPTAAAPSTTQGQTGTMQSAPATSGTSSGTMTQQSGVQEEKGTPTEGTPSNAISSPSTSQPAAQESQMQVFNGCVKGKVNNFEFQSGGKSYHLQGNLGMLRGLDGHQVEISGEMFNDKAIQVNGARDLASSCSKK
jgi:hypothetical protein